MEKIYSTTELTNYTLYMYKNKYIVVKLTNTKEFIQIPSNIQLRFNKSQIIFHSKEEFTNEFNKFINILNLFLSSGKKEVFIKRIKIRGLGYKIVREGSNLVLSLGYSMPIRIEVPLKISNTAIKKNMVIIESYDKMFLGNFVSLLCSLKKRDIYKGKGLSLEYNNQKLKIIKKK